MITRSADFNGAYSDAANWLYFLAREFNGEDLRVFVNGAPVLLIQNPEGADHVLRLNSHAYIKDMRWFRAMLGSSRFSEDGEAWALRKNLTQYYFSKFNRAQAFDIAITCSERALNSFFSKGRNFLRDEELRELPLAILVKNFLGLDLAGTTLEMSRLQSLMDYGSEYAFASGVSAIDRARLSILPTLRRQVFEDLKCFRESSAPSELLANLLVADMDPSNSIQLEHELLTLFLAGSDTTASALGWMFYLLAINEHIYADLKREVMAFWTSSDKSWKSLSDLKLLSAFIAESLRLYPPTPMITRVAACDDALLHHDVRAGDNVFISIVGIHHNKRIYPKAWGVDLYASAKQHCVGADVSFSYGPRVCGGKKFALLELASILAVFLRDAKFELIRDDEPRFYWRSLMVREGGHPVAIVPA